MPSSALEANRLAIAGLGAAAAGAACWLAYKQRQAHKQRPAEKPGSSKGLVDQDANGALLSALEEERYRRQTMLPALGVKGQRALLNSRVLMVGAGGLGSPVGIYLSGVGVGCLGIVDGDIVERSNLHRQIGHREAWLGKNKAISLRQRCLELNGDSNVKAYPERMESAERLAELVREGGYDMLVDCTDSAASRCLVNDAALAAGKPLVAPSAVGFSGQLAVYNLDGGPCYRCVFPPNGKPAGAVPRGVMGPTPGILGTLAALEVVQILAGQGTMRGLTLRGQRAVMFDALDAATPMQTAAVQRRPGCPSCGGPPKHNPQSPQHCVVVPPSQPPPQSELTPKELAKSGDGTCIAFLTRDELSLDDLTRKVADSSCGAVVSFAGNTRDHFEGRGVVQLEYDAYECMAVQEMERIVKEVLAGACGKGVRRAACAHRLGIVPRGETSILIVVAAEHRAEGFDACRYIIDTVKARVPIWKKEIYADGSAWKENREWPSAANGATNAPATAPSGDSAGPVPSTVRVLLFGPAREAMNVDHVDVRLRGGPPAASLADLRAALAKEHAALETLLPASRFALEQRLVQESDEADTFVVADVGLIPPVSGG